MKNMKRVLFFLGMGSCVSSTKNTVEPSSNNHNNIDTLEKVLNTVQSPAWKHEGSKEEAFFDSKPWLESDDEQDFFSVNGDIPPYKQSNKNGDHQGRKLCELFKDSSSFSSDSQTSLKAAGVAQGKDDEVPTISSSNLEKGKSGKSVKHCLPGLVRTLSCGDRKKRPSPSQMAVVAG